jgi:hypothetical protein
MIGIDEGLVKRIRESVLRLTLAPKRALAPVEEQEDNTRASIRQLARSRVSLILRQLRAANGLSYAQIQTQTGLSQQLLFDVEYKERRLSLDELRLLADCYGLGVNDILGIDIE